MAVPTRPEPPGLTDLLAEHSTAVAALTTRLRTIVLAAHPELAEKVYPGWHGLGFRHPLAGYVAALFPREDHVLVGLEHGADLPDPHGLLRGGGRRVRYLRFAPDDIASTDDQLIEYLDLAVDRQP